MLDTLLPRQLDNTYRGSRLALWLFGLVVALKGTQSLAIILNGYRTAKGADGIPLDSFTPAVAQTVVAVFAQAITLAPFLLPLLRSRASSIPKRGSVDVRATRVELRRRADRSRFRANSPRWDTGRTTD
jgi:hypothetical protein